MERLVRTKKVLWALSMFGLVAILVRLFNGLGATTNLSDALPWGLWKVGNMVAGVCLGTSGFVMAAVVYVFKMERYQSLARPAVLIAFLGYGASAFSLFLDIGLPFRIYHAMYMWNVHSFLFEIAMCVMFYLSVCTYEMAPIIVEQKFPKLGHFLHKISFPIMVLGITLSCMHHTSLGSLFLASPTRISPIWFSPWIWGIFITSAIGSGLMSLAFITLLYNKLYGRKPNLDVLGSITKAGAIMLSIYAIWKAIDLSSRGVWPQVFSGEWEGVVFIAETALLVIIPTFIVFSGAARKSASAMSFAAGSAMIGIVMNRLDVGIVSYFRTAGAVYWPSLPEIFVTLGVYAAAGLVFLFVVENFEVFEKPPVRPLGDGNSSAKAIGVSSGIVNEILTSPAAGYSAVAVVSIIAAVGIFSSSIIDGAPMISKTVRPPKGMDNRMLLVINGNDNDVAVAFRHETHKAMLGGTQSCIRCHHLDMPGDQSTACSKCHRDMEQDTPIFSHDYHVEKLDGNKSCTTCHTDSSKPKWRDNVKHCYECHEDDMGIAVQPAGEYFNYRAPGYIDVMHKMCVECHIEMQEEAQRPALEECYTCHGDVELQTVR